MATFGSTIRRGLPRSQGGEPWPSIVAAVTDVRAADDAVTPSALNAEPDAAAERAGVVDVALSGAAPTAGAGTDGGSGPADALRRGLPRVAGGEPWPPPAVGPAPASPGPASARPASAGPASARASSSSGRPKSPAPSRESGATGEVTPDAEATGVRRGLPRTRGGDPWPPAGIVRAEAPAAPAAASAVAQSAPDAAPAATSEPAVPDKHVTPAAAQAGPRPPLTLPRSVWVGRAASRRPRPEATPAKLGPFTRAQWAGAVIVGGGALLVAAFFAVTLVRVVLSLPALQEFVALYPGEYHLPEAAPVGIPAWLGWQHFFNVFLMVLIIRSGLQIRGEKRPTVFWTPRGNRKGKTSLTIWFHQALDVLWLVNGAVFIVLLVVTGHWMRIVPTSWEVFPNALSAALQYVSLDWPTENGWVNYNSLQQLAYFTTVFIAAPLAAVTGYRMSGMWPKKAARLSAAYPVEWARRLHFPVMLYFVVFIFIHVALVFATGALRNLNHMYAAQGSVDGVAYADNWTGFWLFFASMVVIAGAWIAARPLVLAPVARLFGTVSGR